MITEQDPPWLSAQGNCFVKKTYGRIWVRRQGDVERVRALIEQLDPYEFGYMPEDFVAVLDDPEHARLVYGHKFEMRMDILEYACWKDETPVLLVTGYSEAYGR